MKVHYYRSDLPLVPDRTITAICGATVAHARAVYFQDYSVLDMPVYGKNTCKKCMAALKPDPNRHLLYGVCNNQEMMVERSLEA